MKYNAKLVVHAIGETHAANVFISDFGWFLPYYIPNIPQQTFLREQIISRAPTQLSYIERLVLPF